MKAKVYDCEVYCIGGKWYWEIIVDSVERIIMAPERGFTLRKNCRRSIRTHCKKLGINVDVKVVEVKSE